MPASLNLTFPHSELPPSTLSLTLEVIDDPDGPEYDFDGAVQVKSAGLRFQYTFASYVCHVQRWCEQLEWLVKGEMDSAEFSNESETISLVVFRPGENQEYEIRAAIEDAGRFRLQFVGYSVDSMGPVQLYGSCGNSSQGFPIDLTSKKSPRNSSLPPSTQHPHARPPRKPAKSKRKRGGQPGHPRHERTSIPVEQCEQVVSVKPAACRRCGEALAGSDPQPLRHQVWEIPEIRPRSRTIWRTRSGSSRPITATA